VERVVNGNKTTLANGPPVSSGIVWGDFNDDAQLTQAPNTAVVRNEHFHTWRRNRENSIEPEYCRVTLLLQLNEHRQP
jgi:hypothetical protein